jgi:hypothetical protein
LLRDRDFDALRERLYGAPGFSSLDDATLRQLLVHLREFSPGCGRREEHADAARARELGERIGLELQSRQATARTGNPVDSPALSDEAFEAQWDAQYAEFDEATEAKRRELAERQQRGMDAFEEKWREEMPRRYRKPSQTLLQLKQMEKSLAVSGQYDRAAKIQREADKLAANEAQLLQATLVRDYRLAKDEQVQKQNAEREKLEKDRARLRTVLDGRKKTELEQRINRQAVIAQKRSEGSKPARERSGNAKPDCGASSSPSVAESVQSKGKIRENAIPPLLAPNDPTFLEKKDRRMRQKKPEQPECQKRNAELALLDYTLQPSARRDGDEGMASDGEEDGTTAERGEATEGEIGLRENDDATVVETGSGKPIEEEGTQAPINALSENVGDALAIEEEKDK